MTKKILHDPDLDDTDTGDAGTDDGGTGLPTRKPPGFEGGSFLVDETFLMDREQREAEQQGHRQLAKVNAREHHEEQQKSVPEGELQNSIHQHPWLDRQIFDGIDTGPLSPDPPLNSEAYTEMQNREREEQLEKQLRLGNMPKFSSTPEYKP